MPRDLEADRGSGSSRLHPVAAALQSAKARTFVGPWTGWVFKTGHLGLAIFDDGSRHQKVAIDDARILKGLEIAGHIFEGTEQSSSSGEK